MSEQSAEREGQGQRRGQGKKILGLPRGQAIGLGVIALAGLAYLVYRARKNAQAAQAQAASTTGGCPDGSTPDANGNCPQNSQDWSGAIGTLQSEIADLQGAMAGGGSGGGGASGGTAGSTGAGTGTSAGSAGAATGTTTAPPTTAPVTAGPAPSAHVSAGPVGNLRVTSTGTTGFAAAWDAAKNATGYQYIVRDLASHQQVGAPHNTQGTIAVVSGLKSKTDYNLGVQALPGGAGANIHVRTR